MQGFKKISDHVIEVVNVLAVHLNTNKGFNTYPSNGVLDTTKVYIYHHVFENGTIENITIPLEIGLQYNMRTNTFLNPSIAEYIGYSVQGDIITITDPLTFYLSQHRPFTIHISNNKRMLDKAYVLDFNKIKYPLKKGLVYNKSTYEFSNTSPMCKLVPIKEIHSIYTKYGRELRKTAKSLCNIGVYDETYFERNADIFDCRFHLKNNRDRCTRNSIAPEITLMEVIEDPSHLNIALLTLYNINHTYSIEMITYNMITKAIDRAINNYRDSWLTLNEGFSIEEIE